MRKAYSNQLRLDTLPIEKVSLNLECRDSIVPVLKALQHVYADRQLTRSILDLIGADINSDSRTDTGRHGMDYWASRMRSLEVRMMFVFPVVHPFPLVVSQYLSLAQLYAQTLSEPDVRC